jgi:hypothetical protein
VEIKIHVSAAHPFKSQNQAIKYKGKVIHVLHLIILSLPPGAYITLELPQWKHKQGTPTEIFPKFAVANSRVDFSPDSSERNQLFLATPAILLAGCNWT